MKHFLMERLLNQTRQAIKDFNEKEARNISLWMHPDIVWIGAGENQYIRGREKVRFYLERAFPGLPAHSLEQMALEIISCDDSMCVITGQYTQVIYSGSGERITVCRRLTCVWKSIALDWKIFHLHISNPLECQSGNLYKKTQKGAQPSTLKFRGLGAAIYFLQPEEICFVEADNIHSILHTAKTTLAVNQSIGSIAAVLPPGFIRIHRSFIINCAHTAEIKRYLIRMKDGTLLPVPEKRYKTIVRQLSSLIT